MSTPASSPGTGGGRRLLAVLLLGGFVALVALLGWGVSRSDRPDRESLPSPLIGRPAPEFSLPVLHDPDYRVGTADLAGRPYLLNVWGSWCPGCRDEHPVLERYAETRKIRVVGYNWKDEPEDALRWLEQFGNPYWVVVADHEGQTAIEWGVYGAPETFLVDGKGIVRWKHVGALDDTIIATELVPKLEQAEAGR